MDRIDLEPVDFPEHLAVPRVMAYQDFAWNGDGYLAAEVLRLQNKHRLLAAIETGTCLGVTTGWLKQHFIEVSTCEVHEPFLRLAVCYLDTVEGGHLMYRHGDSPEFIPDALNWHNSGDRTFFFLDAHGISGTGTERCPLLDELAAIAKAGVKPVIVIHDMMVPGHPDLGYDRMPDGRPFSIDLVRPSLDAIYGHGNYSHHFNSKSEGAMRGVLYIEPK